MLAGEGEAVLYVTLGLVKRGEVSEESKHYPEMPKLCGASISFPFLEDGFPSRRIEGGLPRPLRKR